MGDTAMQQAMHQAANKLRSATQFAATAAKAALLLLAAAATHLSLPATAATAIEEVVVTAQRTEESLQDVPISVTALTGEMLEDRGLINPSDLQLSAPNVSFTATNFGASSFSIRGIGRLVISSNGDNGVSTHINEIPINTNLNAVEYFDVERVEILRGPQGTLYGRNATGGTINMITTMPNYETIDGFVDAEWGDYNHTRTKGAINLPLGTNMGFRAAFMSLERDGYTKNLAADSVSSIDNSTLPGIDDDIDGRDLHSYRGTFAWDFSDNGNLWVQYNYFEEDDDRSRYTNQVCKRTPQPGLGCEPNEMGFDTPHLGATTGGLFFMINARGAGTMDDAGNTRMADADRGHPAQVVTMQGTLPLGTPGGVRDPNITYDHRAPDLGLREVFTDLEPVFYYEEEIWSWGLDYEFENVTLGILGAYQETDYLQRMDYTLDVGPILHPNPLAGTDGRWRTSEPAGGTGEDLGGGDCNYADGTAGVFGGCVNPDDGKRLFAMDQSSNANENWTLEFRLASHLDGPINFQVGYSLYEAERPGNDYYVNANSLDSIGLVGADLIGFPRLYPTMFNVPSSVEMPSYNEGQALFGEVYWDITDKLKFTVGLRYNHDEKFINDANAFVSAFDQNWAFQTLLGVTAGAQGIDLAMNPTQAPTIISGLVNAGRLNQEYATQLARLPSSQGAFWGRGEIGPEPACLANAIAMMMPAASCLRLGIIAGNVITGAIDDADKAILRFHGVSESTITAAEQSAAFSKERTDLVLALGPITGFNETRGVAGNPDTEEWTSLTGRIGVDWQLTDDILVFGFLTRGYKPGGFNPPIAPEFQGDTEFTFDEEEVDGVELGAKTAILDGELILNGSVFFYDYKGLQVTRIRNNSSINENIDAEITGAELEVVWQPSFIQNFVVDGAFSWLDTSLQDVMSVDVINKGAGDPNWVNLKNIDAGATTGANYIGYAPAITDDVINSAYGFLSPIDTTTPQPQAWDDKVTGLAVPGTVYPNDAFPGRQGQTQPVPAYFSRNFLTAALDAPNMMLGGQSLCQFATQGAVQQCVSSGIAQSLSGNQLPNAPEFTARVGVQYTLPLDAILGALTFRWDYYWQDESYAREFNTVGDQIDAWDQHNLSVIYESANGDWQVRAWVRNAEDEENVTGKYLTSDTSGYWRNYFLTEPRIYGLTARYQFTKE